MSRKMSREWGLFFLILITINCAHAEKNTKKQNIKEQIAPDKIEFKKWQPTLNNPIISDNHLEKIELSLQTLLDECSELIGPQDNDKKHGVHLKRGIYGVVTGKGLSDDQLIRIQPSYLVGRWEKCAHYVTSEPSNLNSFEYNMRPNSKIREIEKNMKQYT